jgi:uncharacterized Zn finger protein
VTSAGPSTTVVLPASPPRRAAARASRWWGKAWVRAVEESSYSPADLLAGRSLARSGRIGQISVSPGRFVAAVEDAAGLWAVLGELPVLEPDAIEGLVEAVAAETGRVAVLLAGDLPYELVEHAEETGVELLPYGGELTTSCSCEAWADPCPHALAVMYQLAWLLDADPLVLFHLRGLPRDELLVRLHGLAPPRVVDLTEADLDTAAEAALLAAALLAEAGQ